MKNLKAFDIELFKLGLGKHEFSFEIGKDFFDNFEDSLTKNGKLTARISLDKSEVLIRAELEIKGVVELVCDRSLRTFEEPIDVSHKLLVKYGEEFDDSEDDIIILDQNLPVWNVANIIYEFIGLQVPYKKIHPELREDDDEPLDLGLEFDFLSLEPEDELVYSTGDTETDEEEEENEGEGEETNENVDPRWQALQKLKDQNKKK
ncbi:DNA-binding protein [Fulvitalea axinellae]|uniref:DNA-binding protein n=1 Tax=Fulvitalea axinellae TaxID=1182444 RepID=A0AAU9CMP3_9BACT|nr:DNA-binding protein [Fulvitalea axinellae]